MATVINNPADGVREEGTGYGMIVGLVLVVLLALLLIFFGLPYLRGTGTTAPATTNGVTGEGSFNVDVPGVGSGEGAGAGSVTETGGTQ